MTDQPVSGKGKEIVGALRGRGIPVSSALETDRIKDARYIGEEEKGENFEWPLISTPAEPLLGKTIIVN